MDRKLGGVVWLAVLVFWLFSARLAAQQNDDAVRDAIIAESISRYSGSCPCPFSVMRNGRRCGGRSAYAKPGGAAPLCYRHDISDEDVRRYRAKHGSSRALPKAPPLAPVATTSSTKVTGQASVIDGDTLEIHGTRIRLEAIDAFESGQTCSRSGALWRCGQDAANWLDQCISGMTVECSITGKDKYQRSLGYCSAGGQDLNAAMVLNGYALAYRQYSDRYIPQEATAKLDGNGAWAPGVEFEKPWEWRNGPDSSDLQQARAVFMP